MRRLLVAAAVAVASVAAVGPALAQDASQASVMAPPPPDQQPVVQQPVVQQPYATQQPYVMQQPVMAPPQQELPGFGTSIALHVTAVVLSVLGSIALPVGLVVAVGCSIGPSDCAGPGFGLALGGAVALITGIVIGSIATGVHMGIRHRRDRMLGMTPTAWLDGHGGGLGLTIEL